MSIAVITNAAVLDVHAGLISHEQSIVIENGLIADIVDRRPEIADARYIDVHGRTVMPGLCDAHVHVTAITPDFALLGRLAPSYVAAHSSIILRDMIHRGFTTVRDAGGADHGLARAVREGLIEGPRLLYCGKAISQTGGHGDMRLPAEEGAPPCYCAAGLGVVVDGVPEVRRACREAIRTGATHIKLMMSGGVSSPTDRISSTQLALDEVEAAVQEASAAGIYCMAHAYTPKAIRRAVTAGVRSIEHGNLLDRETAELMLVAGAVLVPTLSTYDALAKEGLASGLPVEMHEKIEIVLAAGRRALEIARDVGVRTVFGTDLLGPMQKHQLREFAIRGEIQRPADVIRGATIDAARLFDMADQIGAVEVGLMADLIVVEGNPLEDLSVLQQPDRYLKMVLQAGRIIVDRL